MPHARQWTTEEVQILRNFADVAITEIELRALREQTREALSRAEEASRTKGEIMATVAHEIRQPLGVLTMAVPMLRLEDASVREKATRIVERQVTHLHRLVEDLLDIARVEAGRFALKLERLDLRDIVGDLAEALRLTITLDGQSLTVDLPPGPVVVEADSARLIQILTHLLHNAAKFTRDGDEVLVTVGVDGGRAFVRVQDTGRGMTRELLARLFVPFSQGTAGERGGLGLGLAVARGFAEAHGGTIEAHSDGPGRGSAFTVRMPLAAGLRDATA